MKDYATAEQNGMGKNRDLRTRATEGRKEEGRKENGPLISALRCVALRLPGNDRANAVRCLWRSVAMDGMGWAIATSYGDY